MSNNVVHFAIHADNCERAKAFYESTFGWEFEPWGPPNFWRIHTGVGAIHGALQERRAPVEGAGMIGFECTIGVNDLAVAVAAIKANGATITMPPFEIEGVGTLATFQDTEGNAVGVMQYAVPQ